MVAAVQLVANGAVAAAGGGQAGGDEAKGGDGFSALLSAVGGDSAGGGAELGAGLAAQVEALVRENIADGKDILLQAVAIAVAAPVQLVQNAEAANDIVLDGAQLLPELPVELSQDVPLDLGAQLSGSPEQGVSQNGLQIADEVLVADTSVSDLKNTESIIVTKTEKGEVLQAAAKTDGLPDTKPQVSAHVVPVAQAAPAPQVQLQSQAQVQAALVNAEATQEPLAPVTGASEKVGQPLVEAPVKLVVSDTPVVQQSAVAEAPKVATQPQIATNVATTENIVIVTDQGDAGDQQSVAQPQDQNNAKPKAESASVPLVVSADVKAPTARNDAPSAAQQLAQNNAPVVEVIADSGAQSGGQQSSGGQQQGASQPSVTLPQPLVQQVSGNAPGSVAPSHFSQHLAQASAVPVLDQVMVHLRNNQHDGSSRIQIQLEPVELGKIEIRLDVAADGKTGVTVTAENRAALETLQRDVRGLERALNDAGLKTDSGSLSFNLRGEQQDHQQQGRKQAQNYSKKSAQEEEELQAIGQIVSRSLSLSVRDGLDIHI